ncbi:CoA ester lyase [Carboxydocella sp. JDF658]|uniref:HpcH/HpaI aldolase/citrate lyase family protein n=1 Tax=Carboxydocella sp. JDF658 TaxID=1926600 RepID=UPI0009AD55D3|nr:CoA ester lyase [Carboxydocella sp. JDF658]GAW30463.1 CoA ester lyase [Carboxydocella sp. JDF658]
MKPLRTFMFAPGSDSKKSDKVLTLGADAVILDLEDAVAISEKEQARKVVQETLLKPRGCKAYVRVNSISTNFFFDDLEAVFCSRLDGIMLPKAESAEDIRMVDWLITEGEKKRGLPPGQIDLIPLIESAAGVYRAAEIASASPRISRLAFGAIDFSLDIGTTWSKDGNAFFYARSQLVIASRVAGIEAPIDTVYPEIKDIDGLVEECRLVRSMGFQSKLVIHPGQIEPVNKVFSPTPDEIAQARKIVVAFEEAEKQGLAAIQVDGKFIDYPVAMRAKKLLAIAEALGM